MEASGSIWFPGVSIALRFLIWKFQLYTHKREDGVISPLLLLPSLSKAHGLPCFICGPSITLPWVTWNSI